VSFTMTSSEGWWVARHAPADPADDAAFDADYLANLGSDLYCTFDGSADDVRPVRITTHPDDTIAFARITELCAPCRAAIDSRDVVAVASRLTFENEEYERLDAAAVLCQRYAGPLDYPAAQRSKDHPT